MKNTNFAEANVLGAMVLDSSAIHRVKGIVSESDFATSYNREIWRTILALEEKSIPVDILSVMGNLSGDMCKSLIGDYVRSTYAPTNAELYAELIRDASIKRETLRFLKATIEGSGNLDSVEIISEVQSKLESLIHRSSGKGTAFSEAFSAALSAIDQASITTGPTGVPTGLFPIDDRIGGLQAPRLVIVAARPSIGKTALVNQIGLHAAEQGFGVGVCSLEMGEPELAIRSMANRYQVNGSALAFGNETEIALLLKKIPEKPIADLPIWIDSETFNLPEITARITEWKRNHHIKLAVVDHIGLVEVDGNHSANDRLGIISRALKKLAKRLEIPVIAVSQLNRNVEKEKRWPTLADLRDSGSIEQDADIAVFLHADAESEGERLVPMHLGLLKNRVGCKGWLREKFIFNGPTQTFYVEGRW